MLDEMAQDVEEEAVMRAEAGRVMSQAATIFFTWAHFTTSRGISVARDIPEV
jgi:hypothetical protein